MNRILLKPQEGLVRPAPRFPKSGDHKNRVPIKSLKYFSKWFGPSGPKRARGISSPIGSGPKRYALLVLVVVEAEKKHAVRSDKSEIPDKRGTEQFSTTRAQKKSTMDPWTDEQAHRCNLEAISCPRQSWLHFCAERLQHRQFQMEKSNGMEQTKNQ